jgi:hypothetical protein
LIAWRPEAVAQTGPGLPQFPDPKGPICQEIRRNRCEFSQNSLDIAKALMGQAPPKCINDLVMGIRHRMRIEGIREEKLASKTAGLSCKQFQSNIDRLSSEFSAVLRRVASEEQLNFMRKVYDQKTLEAMEQRLYRCLVEQDRLQFETVLLSKDAYNIEGAVDHPERILTGEMACIYKAPRKEDLNINNETGLTAMRVEEFAPCDGRKPRSVIAITGTKKKLSDWIGNLSFGVDKLRASMSKFQVWINEGAQSGQEIVITGHSLGGGLAQSVAFIGEKNLWDTRETVLEMRGVRDVKLAEDVLDQTRPEVMQVIHRAMSKTGASLNDWSPKEKIELTGRTGKPTFTVHHNGQALEIPINNKERETITNFLQAQAVLERNLESERNARNISVVTWNAFGARELLGAVASTPNGLFVEKNRSTIPVTQDHQAMARMSSVQNATNFFVAADEVSGIGNHIGAVRKVAIGSPKGAIESHTLNDYLIPQLRMRKDKGVLMYSTVVRPPMDTPTIANYGGVQHVVRNVNGALMYSADVQPATIAPKKSLTAQAGAGYAKMKLTASEFASIAQKRSFSDAIDYLITGTQPDR